MSFLGLVLNLLILGALGYTIYFGLKLSNQFKQIQLDRKAFETLIQSLGVAAAQADQVVRAIRDSAVVVGEQLQEKTGRARALADELEIIIQAGDSLADRLQTLATEARKSVSAPAPAEEPPRTKAEKELLDAMRKRP